MSALQVALSEKEQGGEEKREGEGETRCIDALPFFGSPEKLNREPKEGYYW